MNIERIQQKFARMGSRLELMPPRRRQDAPLEIDVREDRGNETFLFHALDPAALQVEVLDLRPGLRHLLLLHREAGVKHKFLCGHDERHWFVAAVPESATFVRSVETAFEALRPEEVSERCSRGRLRRKRRFSRRNDAYVRQGEWFFVPAPEARPDPLEIHRNEPLSRGGKPHVMEFSFRRGGETVYLASQVDGPLLGFERDALQRKQPEARWWDWTVQTANPDVHAMGTVRHPDHATIELRGWHRVFMNTESRALARKRVIFVD